MTALEVSITKGEAETLTARIRGIVGQIERNAGQLRGLVAEAREREAWKALGYSGWTRQRAHQMLEEQRVFGELTAAAGSNVGHVSGRAARDIADALPEVAERIRERVESEPETPPETVVAEEVSKARQRATKPRQPVVDVEPNAPRLVPGWLADIWKSVETAANEDGVDPELWVRTVLNGAIRARSKRRQVRDLHAQGLSHQKIAEKVGQAKSTVQEQLKDCLHPIGRRLGDFCAACGQTVKHR